MNFNDVLESYLDSTEFYNLCDEFYHTDGLDADYVIDKVILSANDMGIHTPENFNFEQAYKMIAEAYKSTEKGLS